MFKLFLLVKCASALIAILNPNSSLSPNTNPKSLDGFLPVQYCEE